MKTPVKYIACILGLIIFVLSRGQAQVVYVPLHHPIYDYLDRLVITSIIDWDGAVKPVSRIEVARLLLRADGRKSGLTKVECDELEYYEREFSYELAALGYANDGISARWHLYTYRDSLFSIYLDPVLGETINDGVSHFFNGAKFNGYLGSNVGYGFHFNDNQEKGRNIDRVKQFVPETGINVVKSTGPEEIEYDDVRTYISYGTDRLQLFLGKDFVEWGSGSRGQLILSDKAPSFPMIRLDFTPTPWLRFHYLHGWLKSLVLDSSRSYETQIPDARRNVYREKYIAAHMLSVTPLSGLNFSLGESIIYSDGSPNILFLIPIMFFRAADHYLTNNHLNDGSNSQFFFDAKYDFLNHVAMYGTLFIDEITPSAIFDEKKARNQLGYTLGTRVVNPALQDVDITLEYTRILPWVYSNSNQTQLFENSGYLLGHYIGQNADQFYTNINWRPIRGLLVSAFYDYVRRGGETDVQKQYELPSLPFLYGDVQRVTAKGIGIQYEYIHDLVGRCDFSWQNPYISRPSFQIEVTVEYGLPLR